MAVNQKQIAEKLGVSIALVSRVLSGRAAEIGIAPKTIEKVLEASREMGYVPSAAALSLKGKPTRTVGVAVYDFNDPFFGALIQQIQIRAHARNYSLILAGFLNRIPDQRDLHPLHKHAMDGLIVLGSDIQSDWLSDFSTLPTARIGHGPADEPGLQITIDESDAAGQLVDLLLQTGRSRAVFLGDNIASHRTRKESFCDAARAQSMDLSPVEFPAKNPFAAGLHATARLLQKGPPPPALVCATDQVALGALRALHEAGIQVPHQVAVTGFDDIPAAAQCTPALTTIRQPIMKMAQQAFDAIRHPQARKVIRLKGELVQRETTARTPKSVC